MSTERPAPLGEAILARAAMELNAGLDRTHVLVAIRDLTCDALQVEVCSVLLLDESGQRLEFQVAYNRLPRGPEEAPPLERGEGLAGWVLAHGRSARVDDAEQDERLRHSVDRTFGVTVRALIAVPVTRGADVIGVLEAINPRAGRFGDEDLALLEALGNQFSVALQNVQLFEVVQREKRENELMNRVALELARTLRLEEILPLLVGLLRELIAFDAVGIYLYHRESGLLEWFYGHGYPEGTEEQVRLKLGQGAVGWTAQHRRPLILPDVASDPRYLRARAGTRSEMSVPLFAEGELVGIFNLESDRADAFHGRDLQLLTSFGHHAAIAIHRAWLHDESVEKRRLEEEIGIARRIQLRLLPESDPVFPGFDITGFNHPSREVSGDAYDYVPIAEGQLGLMIGDVSGKGVAAGLLMAAFRASLRAEIRNNYAISVILSKVNLLMWESSELDAYVTAVYGVLDGPRRRFTYANAGHNPPAVWRGDGRVEWLTEGGLMLGSFPDAKYQEAWVDLEPEDLVVLYTDGITEALSPAGEMFGTERLVEVLARREPAESARRTCARLLEAVRTHTGGVHAEDDLTAVVVRAVGKGRL
jgi:sigma-B regulation protein RsbU (phosphoserine phosphatase)